MKSCINANRRFQSKLKILKKKGRARLFSNNIPMDTAFIHLLTFPNGLKIAEKYRHL